RGPGRRRTQLIGTLRIDTIGPFGLAHARERRKNIALSRVAEGPARRSHSNRSFGTLVLIPTQVCEGLRKIRFARWQAPFLWEGVFCFHARAPCFRTGSQQPPRPRRRRRRARMPCRPRSRARGRRDTRAGGPRPGGALEPP